MELAYVPIKVLHSRKISDGEFRAYMEMLNARNRTICWCDKSDSDIARLMGIPERTLQSRIASLKEKRFINITPNPHKHSRRMFFHIPGEPNEKEQLTPTDEEIKAEEESLKQAYKLSIDLYATDFATLVEKIRESPLLDEVEDNSTQFSLTLEQARFLQLFRDYFPRKKIDCQIAAYPEFDYNQLITRMRNSDFIKRSDNLTLKWCLEHRDVILSGKHETDQSKKKQDFTGRNYTREQMNALFQDIDDIEI